MLMHLFLFSLFLALAVLSQSAESSLQPGPARDPADLTVWPNQISRSNSDGWIVQHHESIRRMNPRLLVVNFSNERSREHLDGMVNELIRAIAESSRYHGYRNPEAPAFLQYQVFRFVDLRDSGKTTGNSAKVPYKKDVTNDFNLQYDAFFNDDFARHYGVADPKEPSRFLRLDELVELGYVHELWFFAESTPELKCYECVEEKPVYNERFERQGNRFVQAGNGGDNDQRWTGRSLRLNNINPDRGIGCVMENLAHSLEGMANSKSVPWFTRYFHEFAGHDLNTRYDLPWPSFYPLWGEDKGVEYPDPKTAVIRFGPRTYRLENYIVFGGNAHFPPNARRHYDLENTAPVNSTIEDWRIGSGPDGRDLVKPWTNAAFETYRNLAPDCMGAWLIYWRQNMPGLDNRQKDDAGRPMKNWWPFLFY